MRDTIADELNRTAAGLAPVFPDPETLDARTREIADAAVEGFALVHYLGDHRVPIGRTNTNWKDDERGTQLNAFVFRTTFIGCLADAFALTGEVEYAEAARDYLENYLASYPLEVIGRDERADSTLDMAGRNVTWSQSLHKLAKAECFSPELVERIATFILGQLAWLKDHLKAANWRVFEAKGLLTCCLFLDFLEPAAALRRNAVRVLNDAWHRQFLPDGVHFERNPIYHGGMAGTFLQLYRVARLRPDLGLVMELEDFVPMFDFSLACAKPNGYLCGIHDSQSEFTGHLRDGTHTQGHKAVDKYGEWETFRKEFDLGLDTPPPSQVFPDAGLAFARTGWDEDALWISFDATYWGGGHCHFSRNALQLHAHRRSMVIDPGWLAYDGGAWGRYGKSTVAHPTCMLGGRDQVSNDPRTFQHYHAEGYDALLAIYDGGYWETEPGFGHFNCVRNPIYAEHGRLVLRVGGRFVFVADSMFRTPTHAGDPAGEQPSFECIWPLAPAAELTLDEEGDRVLAQWADAGLLMLTPIRPEGARYVVHEGERDPVRGWVPGDGEHTPAPQVVVDAPRMTKRHEYCVSVLAPFAGSDAPNVAVEAKSPMGATGYVRLRWEDGSSDSIHWGCNLAIMLGAGDGFETDASLVHLRRDPTGNVTGGCCVNGTFCEPFTKTTRKRPETFLIAP